jgi:hypothetical protein
MDFIQDIRCNDVLGAPPGVSIEQCRALPIRRAQLEDGIPVVQSFWRPTPQELKMLNSGAPVVLSIFGHTHAPVTMQVVP